MRSDIFQLVAEHHDDVDQSANGHRVRVDNGVGDERKDSATSDGDHEVINKTKLSFQAR